jgi:hypothetical protein
MTVALATGSPLLRITLDIFEKVHIFPTSRIDMADPSGREGRGKKPGTVNVTKA